MWSDAEFVYDKFCQVAEIINTTGDREAANEIFKEIFRYMNNPKIAYNRKKRTWRCYRAKHIVNFELCKVCQTSKVDRENLKLHSESIKGDVAKHWTEEPCLFECGLDLDRETYMTIEQSIQNNFWKT
jgi:hypothetical protein